MSILTSKILMVRPVAFTFNEQTALNNAFQQEPTQSTETVQAKALREFDGMVSILREKGVEVVAIEDTPEPHTPDSIFPNNWFSTHPDGTVVYYPMFAPNRRNERKPAVKDYLKTLPTTRIIDITHFELEDQFLEGTGSLIIDHTNKLVFANISQRTNADLFHWTAEKLGFKGIIFDAVDQNNFPIYHTNVLMALGHSYVVICLAAIPKDQQAPVIKAFEDTGRKIVDITFEQMNAFAGNMMQLHSQQGEPILVMSQAAYESLREDQVVNLEAENELVPVPIPTIETIGGGSVRCMIAELYI